jgi:V-type H+-transporting ATPase subunit a
MFGDAGHGLVVLGFGLWMCIKEKQLEARKIDSEIWKIFFAGRYLITLMAMFSIYTGLIYNDVFSKSINVFGSSWHTYQSDKDILGRKNDMIDPSSKHGWYGTPYPFGVDPVWQVADNKIVFLNAFKMKISIILGVLHMIFGVCMSFGNHKYFSKPMNIITEFIPQLLFLCCLFGYLALLMFIKWTKYYANKAEDEFGLSERCAPSILITFINMVLFRANTAEEGCEPYIFGGQRGIQSLLVLVALGSILRNSLSAEIFFRI